MRPKQLRRLWLRFMADKDWDIDSALYGQANTVLWWIERLIDNIGYDCEAWMRRNLAEQLATFSKMSAEGRG